LRWASSWTAVLYLFDLLPRSSAFWSHAYRSLEMALAHELVLDTTGMLTVILQRAIAYRSPKIATVAKHQVGADFVFVDPIRMEFDGLASASRNANTMSMWWKNSDGVMVCATWTPSTGWTSQQISAEGTTANGGIAAVSRIPSQCEVFWVNPFGAVEAAHFDESTGWSRYTLTPNHTAYLNTKIAAVSRIPTSIELWWIGADGSVRDAYWYEGSGWHFFTLAPAGSAATVSGISAISAYSNHMELWWISPDGSVNDAYWYDSTGWQRFYLAPTGSAQPQSSIASVSRMEGHMEVFWVTPEGAVSDAYYYPELGWQRFFLSPPGTASWLGGVVVEKLCRRGNRCKLVVSIRLDCFPTRSWRLSGIRIYCCFSPFGTYGDLVLFVPN
jgi:hypothetical protein